MRCALCMTHEHGVCRILYFAAGQPSLFLFGSIPNGVCVCVCACISVVMPGIDAAHCSLLSVDRVRTSASPTQQVPWHIRIRNAASCTPLAWCGTQCEEELCMRRGKWIYLSLPCGHNGEFEADPPCAGWMTVSRMRQRVHWAPICKLALVP